MHTFGAIMIGAALTLAAVYLLRGNDDFDDFDAPGLLVADEPSGPIGFHNAKPERAFA